MAYVKFQTKHGFRTIPAEGIEHQVIEIDDAIREKFKDLPEEETQDPDMWQEIGIDMEDDCQFLNKFPLLSQPSFVIISVFAADVLIWSFVANGEVTLFEEDWMRGERIL